MKSYFLPLHDRIKLLAFQTVLPRKTVYVGFTITPDPNKLSPTGQQVLNAIVAYSTSKNLAIFIITQPKGTLKRFRRALKSMKDGDAIFIMEAEDGLGIPILNFLHPEAQEECDVEKKYRIPDDWGPAKLIEDTIWPPESTKH